jgi:uncharacterized circularly permuted ATP-grasp superfamily protein/uncharacterized alpha-E superfamily protein
MCTSDGAFRSHWEYVIQSLGTLGPGELHRRGQEAQRLLKENGVTYNVYGDPQGSDRPWSFDPIPFLISSQEWSTIEGGLIQRAELLDLILADIYGSRDLIRRGLLPPELIFAHPGFLRCCQGITPVKNRWLHFYAVDLARAANGTMWVLSDRTQAPSGSGYALENRIVLSRTLPSLYRDSHVHRLALYFRTIRATLTNLGRHLSENPQIVLLTPGSGNETFFEHSYLANYLGFPLVHGGDLTVRDRKVWLKTLDGLQPVHVILRRLDDTFCDPLELRNDSLLGTPGLVEAARAGSVVIANPLGSGVVENPGLNAFLPKLCRELLGEDLLLPSVASWWCGNPADRDYVLANLARLVIKPIYSHPTTSLHFGPKMSEGQLQYLADRIRAHPTHYVGQERVDLSTTPVLDGDLLQPRPMVLRSFLMSRDESYVVMPGGLTRVSASPESWIVSSQYGGSSKDTWVLASEPEKPVSLLGVKEGPIALSRGGGEIPSRLADNLFWLGRYAERTESIARLLRQLLLRLLSSESDPSDECLTVLFRSVAGPSDNDMELVFKESEEATAISEAELLGFLLDTRRVGSLTFNVNSLISAGRSVRDRLSDDTLRVLNTLGDELGEPTQLSFALESIERLILVVSAFAGLSAENMTRGQGWRFLDMGRRIERAINVINLLTNIGVGEKEPGRALWEMVLAATDCSITYRRRYQDQLEAAAVLDLLLHDESNPRSVGYQLVRLQEHVTKLPTKPDAARRSPEERYVLEAVTTLRLADMDSLTQLSASEEQGALQDLLTRLESRLQRLSDSIRNSYFEHIEAPRQLVGF